MGVCSIIADPVATFNSIIGGLIACQSRVTAQDTLGLGAYVNVCSAMLCHVRTNAPVKLFVLRRHLRMVMPCTVCGASCQSSCCWHCRLPCTPSACGERTLLVLLILSWRVLYLCYSADARWHLYMHKGALGFEHQQDCVGKWNDLVHHAVGSVHLL